MCAHAHGYTCACAHIYIQVEIVCMCEWIHARYIQHAFFSILSRVSLTAMLLLAA